MAYTIPSSAEDRYLGDEKRLQIQKTNTMSAVSTPDNVALMNNANHQGFDQSPSISISRSRTTTLPSLNYSLLAHKKGIVITWSVLLLTTLILPILLYFILKYPANLDTTIILAVTTATFGASSTFNLSMRTYKLLKPNSTVRPLGGTRWAMDYFNLNFLAGIIWVTAVIVMGNVIESVRVASMALPLLIMVTGLQMVVAVIMQSLGMKCPVRISSVPRGASIRGGAYAIAEDIIGVDSDGGRAFREAMWKRWEVSEEFRRLLFVLDAGWGFSAVAVGAICIGIMFGGIVSEDAAWCVGWTVPWAFAGIGATLTVIVCKVYLKRERERLGNVTV